MPPIKNWKRSGRYSRGGGAGFEAGWKNRKTGSKVFIQTNPVWADNSDYRVVTKKDRGSKPDATRTRSRHGSFEDARAAAVSWMRDHKRF